MRWKLANGGVIASTKQPINGRDFNRLELVSVDYTEDESLEEAFPDQTPKSKETNWRDLEFTVRLYNPSTHIIQLSHNYGHAPAIAICNDSRRRLKCASRGDSHIYDLTQGCVTETYIYPSVICNPRCHTWTGFGKCDPEKLPEEYINGTYTVTYRPVLVMWSHGNRYIDHIQHENTLSITFLVRK